MLFALFRDSLDSRAKIIIDILGIPVVVDVETIVVEVDIERLPIVNFANLSSVPYHCPLMNTK